MRATCEALWLVAALVACDTRHPAQDSGAPMQGRDADTPSMDASAGDEAQDAAPPRIVAMPDAGGPTIDPLQCHILCSAADGAGCKNRPDHQTCFDLCSLSIDRCPKLVMSLLDCFDPFPMYECDADGNLASTGCAQQLERVQACVADADAG
jgi:hypothetical protein